MTSSNLQASSTRTSHYTAPAPILSTHLLSSYKQNQLRDGYAESIAALHTPASTSEPFKPKYIPPPPPSELVEDHKTAPSNDYGPQHGKPDSFSMSRSAAAPGAEFQQGRIGYQQQNEEMISGNAQGGSMGPPMMTHQNQNQNQHRYQSGNGNGNASSSRTSSMNNPPPTPIKSIHDYRDAAGYGSSSSQSNHQTPSHHQGYMVPDPSISRPHPYNLPHAIDDDQVPRGFHATINPQIFMTEYSAGQIATLQNRLAKKLGPEYITQRTGPGGAGKLSYVEGWKVINLANEVFGFNGWSSQVVSLTTDYLDPVPGDAKKFSCGISSIIRITLRDGTFHEDTGYGQSDRMTGKGTALDKARKEAVTDGVKRTLKTFGNVLGNCLYDKEYAKQITSIKVTVPKLNPKDLWRRAEFDEEFQASGLVGTTRPHPETQDRYENPHAYANEAGSRARGVTHSEHTSAIQQQRMQPRPDAQAQTSVPTQNGYAPPPSAVHNTSSDARNKAILAAMTNIKGLETTSKLPTASAATSVESSAMNATIGVDETFDEIAYEEAFDDEAAMLAAAADYEADTGPTMGDMEYANAIAHAKDDKGLQSEEARRSSVPHMMDVYPPMPRQKHSHETASARSADQFDVRPQPMNGNQQEDRAAQLANIGQQKQVGAFKFPDDLGPNSVGRVESSPGQDESKMMSGKSSGSTGSKFSHTSGRGIKRTSGEGVGHQEVRTGLSSHTSLQRAPQVRSEQPIHRTALGELALSEFSDIAGFKRPRH